MTAILKFDSSKFSPEALRLILATSQQGKCSPQEALQNLLDEAARRAGFNPQPPADDQKKVA